MPTTTIPPETVYSLTVEISTPENIEYFKGRPYFRVLLEVTEVIGFLDTNLFVHERKPLPGDEYRDEFIGVAGPVDLLDIGDEPNERNWLRKSTIDVLIESHRLYDELITVVKAGLQELVDGMYRLDRLQITDVLDIP